MNAAELRAGLIDLRGRSVLPCKYDSLDEPNCGLMKCRREPGSVWEYIDFAGKPFIALKPNQIGNAFDRATGLARLSEKRDGKNCYGLIDTTGRTVVPVIYAAIGVPSEGLFHFATHEKPGLYGYADLSGKVVIPQRFHRVESLSFSCGLAMVSYPDVPEEYYFIDHGGKHVLGPVYKGGEYSDVFKAHGIVLLADPTNNSQHVMDRSGRTLLKAPRGIGFTRIREGLIEAQDQRLKKTGIMNLAGRWVIEPKYDSVFGPENGYIRVLTDDGVDVEHPTRRLNEREALFDTAGREIIPLGKWTGLGYAGCGLGTYSVETDKGPVCGCISLPGGEIVIPAKFPGALSFSEGFSTVRG